MTTEAVHASDLHAEQAVLGSMMMSPVALAAGLEALRGGDFYRPAHTVIFEAMAAMDAANLPVDPITLRERLDAHPENGRYGGAMYLHDLLEAVPTTANVSYYAGLVAEHSARRRLAVAGTRILQVAASPDTDAGTRADQAGRFLEEATRDDSSRGEPVLLAALLPEFLEELEAGPDTAPGVPVDWPAMQPYMAKLRPGELITVGGRPGTGKSSVLLGLCAVAAIRHKIPTLLLTLEMGRMEIVQRIVAAKCRVPLTAIRNRDVSDADLQRIADALSVLAEVPLLINDDPFPKINDIRGQLRGMRRRGNDCELLAVDYLQLMTGNGTAESRQIEVAENARGLKLTAKEFRCAVVVGSQLNRGPEGRADKRPMLGDLRESGSVEQDSDAVWLLYRDKIYNPDSTESQVLELSIAKQRNGPTGVVTLAFKDPYSSVENLARDNRDPQPAPARTRPAPHQQPPPLPFRPAPDDFLDDDEPEA